ncbi:MAG: YdcF family protein [Acidimicrobiales bacterium]
MVKLAILVFALLGAYLAVTFVQVWWASRRDDARPADAIVVLGAAQYNGVPSSILRARLDHAYDLYSRKLAPVIVVTGGKQPGDQFTEAQASAAYLHGKDVPDEDILREVSGTSSWESLAAASQFLNDRSIKTVLLVSDAFHSFRVDAIADELGLDGHPSPTRTSPITGLSAARHLFRETVAVAVGRIIGYRREAGIQQKVETGAGVGAAVAGRSTGASAHSAQSVRWSPNRSAGAWPESTSS